MFCRYTKLKALLVVTCIFSSLSAWSIDDDSSALVLAGAIATIPNAPSLLDESLCAFAYDEPHFKGTAWRFCPGIAPQYERWNDKLSSIKIQPNSTVRACTERDGTGICRTYFQDAKNVGEILNNKFSYVEVAPFNFQNFNMILMSDTQFDRCEVPYCQNEAQTADRANEWHLDSAKSIASMPNFAGVIVNGDLTNDLTWKQLTKFKNVYENSGLNIYPGLGNHDYQNHFDKVCDDRGRSNYNAFAKYLCTRNMLEFLEQRIDTLNADSVDLDRSKWARDGSYAYSWTIGSFTFVQLNNHPATTASFEVYVSTRAGRESYNIFSSLSWLERELNSIPPDQNIIINLHHANFSSSDREFAAFKTLLGDHANVRAIFAGHIHQWVGEYDLKDFPTNRDRNSFACQKMTLSQPVAGLGKPVFYTGSAEYNTFLAVEFSPSSLRVQAIDSTEGRALSLCSPTAITW